MSFKRDKWSFPDSNEYEIKYVGNYGARGEKRAPKRKPSPEQIKRQNQYNREKNVRRLIKPNFEPGDIWATLKYPAGTLKDVSEVRKDVRNFLRKLRRVYKKREQSCKYIYRLDISKRGGVHIHILVNRLRGTPNTDVVLQEAWIHGRVYYTNIYEQGGYQALAEYITKQPDKEIEGQLSLFPEDDRKDFITYSTSRNLIRPVPERKEYKRRTVRKLIEDGPIPTPGYYIDKNSITSGVNPYTGMSYYYYIEVRCVDFISTERRQE